MGNFARYIALLFRYHAMIRSEPWWEDGRRDALVVEMDPIWGRMSDGERGDAIRYAMQLYEDGLKAVPSTRELR